MTKVNEWILRSLLDPLGGTADIDDDKSDQLQQIGNNNKAEVKEIIIKHIKPFFESKSDEFKKKAKDSLSFFLTTDQTDFGYLFDSCLIAFDHPNNPKDFFIWIWEILFPNESFKIDNTENFLIENDLNEANKYL